jgi:hypothetical protein
MTIEQLDALLSAEENEHLEFKEAKYDFGGPGAWGEALPVEEALRCA